MFYLNVLEVALANVGDQYEGTKCTLGHHPVVLVIIEREKKVSKCPAPQGKPVER